MDTTHQEILAFSTIMSKNKLKNNFLIIIPLKNK